MQIKLFNLADISLAIAYLSPDPVKHLILLHHCKTALATQVLNDTLYGLWKDDNLHGVGIVGEVVAWAGAIEIAQLLGEKMSRTNGYDPRLLVGTEPEIEVFMNAFRNERDVVIHKQLFYALRRGELQVQTVEGLNLTLAKPAQSEELFQIFAEMYMALTGQPPTNPETSAQRLMRRIEEGKIWVICENDEIIFKTDVAIDIEDTILLEGIWTKPELRRRQIGTKALTLLCSRLLLKYPQICLYFREDSPFLKKFYEQIGFKYNNDCLFVRYLSASENH